MENLDSGRQYCDAFRESDFLNPIRIQVAHYYIIHNSLEGIEKEIGLLQEFFRGYNDGIGITTTSIKDGHILVVKNGKYRPYFEF